MHAVRSRLLPALIVATVVSGLWAVPARAATVVSFSSIIPAPVTATASPGVTFNVTSGTKVYVEPGSAQVAAVGDRLAALLRTSTGYPVPVVAASSATDGIGLFLSGAPGTVGAEGYQLDVTASAVAIRALQPAGLNAGVQTLHQLLPTSVDAATVQSGPWPVPGGHVVDYPRFGYRSIMLDVARHFFSVATVQRLIDQAVLYKANYLHLHLSDDQGWRIAVNSWPNLAVYGGSTAVGGDPGGYYTQADYTAIVNYAAARFVTVVPEIDMPGHTNAALASYAQLNCNNTAPPLYTGTNVGFSSLCVGKELTYTFIDQVIGELAALTPGPYIHIGGDEASSTTAADYATFLARVQPIVTAKGKTVLGWHDIANTTLSAGAVPQFWGTTTSNAAVANAVAQGHKVVMSPANKAYLDMKYTRKHKLGQTWAGLIEVKTAYEWNPGAYLSGVGESGVLGVEGPLWTETIRTAADVDNMVFPRLPALMELAWSPYSTHNWTAFSSRLGAQGPRWKTMGINYYKSTQITWPVGS